MSVKVEISDVMSWGNSESAYDSGGSGSIAVR